MTQSQNDLNTSMASGVQPQYGQRKTRVDFDQRAAEPRDEVFHLEAKFGREFHAWNERASSRAAPERVAP
jgi:hypothetical protein